MWRNGPVAKRDGYKHAHCLGPRGVQAVRRTLVTPGQSLAVSDVPVAENNKFKSLELDAYTISPPTPFLRKTIKFKEDLCGANLER